MSKKIVNLILMLLIITSIFCSCSVVLAEYVYEAGGKLTGGRKSYNAVGDFYLKEIVSEIIGQYGSYGIKFKINHSNIDNADYRVWEYPDHRLRFKYEKNSSWYKDTVSLGNKSGYSGNDDNVYYTETVDAFFHSLYGAPKDKLLYEMVSSSRPENGVSVFKVAETGWYHIKDGDNLNVRYKDSGPMQFKGLFDSSIQINYICHYAI